jgi:hypothetical protein
MSNGPWTISKLHQWEGCGLQYALEHQPAKVIGRFKGWKLADVVTTRVESPAMQRGSEIHDGLDRYIRGAADKLPEEAATWWTEVEALAAVIQEGADQGGTEVMWQYDDEWYPTDERAKVWHRQKLDAWWVDERESLVVDFKTGRYYPKNEEQMQVYALGMFARFDQVETVTAELWYIDRPDNADTPIISKVFTREKDSAKLAKRWNSRAAKFIDDEKFRVNPGVSCRWCPFNAKKGGPCTAGV